MKKNIKILLTNSNLQQIEKTATQKIKGGGGKVKAKGHPKTSGV